MRHEVHNFCMTDIFNRHQQQQPFWEQIIFFKKKIAFPSHVHQNPPFLHPESLEGSGWAS